MSEKKAFVLRIDPDKLKAIEKWAADEFRSIKTQLSEIKRENKPKVNTALVAFLSIVIGIVLTLIYQWMM